MTRKLVPFLLLALACSGNDDPAADLLDAADVPADVATDAPDTAADAAPDAPADTPTDLPEPPRKVRFLHISDIHVYGTHEAPDTAALAKAVQHLNGLDYDADFVVATGDYVDWLPDGLPAAASSTLRGALDTLAGLRWPLRTLAGNHEYYRNEQLEMTQDKAGRDQFLADVLGHPLDFAYDVGGVRFVALNGMAGDLWQKNNGLLASFTDDQLEWLRDQLNPARPSVLFLHMPPTSEAETGTGDSLCKALADRPGAVKAIFAGHLHGFWRGTVCDGIPYYLVVNTRPEVPFYFQVEVDGATGAVTIQNEASVTFGSIPEFECDPLATGFPEPATLVGTHQVLEVGAMVSNLTGLEGLEGDGLNKVPLALRFDAWDADRRELRARLTEGVLDAGFVAYLDGAPCVDLVFDVAGPCLRSRPVGFDLNLLPLLSRLLEITPDPSWVAALTLQELRLDGRVAAAEGAPTALDGGIVHIAASGERTLDDLKNIVVSEYCGGRIAACTPGQDDLPACPATPGPAFFDEIPDVCDVSLGSYSLRLVLALVSGYPLENVALVGEYVTHPLETSAAPAEGKVDETLFSTGEGFNCAL